MVDANSAYRLEDAPLLKQLDAFYLIMIEQPLGWDDIYSHVELQRQLETPICLDECIHDVEHARAAIEIGACRIINIKLGRVGGHTAARRIHDLCQAKSDPRLVRRHARIRHRPRAQHRHVYAPEFHAARRRLRQPPLLDRRHHRARSGSHAAGHASAFPPRPASATHRASTASNRSPSAARSSTERFIASSSPNLTASAAVTSTSAIETSRTPSKLTLLFWLFVMLMLWSFNYIAGKIALRTLDPITLACFRLELAALVMLPIYFAQPNRAPLRLRDIWPFAYLGFFGVIVNQGLFTVGLNFTTSDHSAVIIAVGPIIILFLARALKLEALTVGKIVGMAISFAGVIPARNGARLARQFALPLGRPDHFRRRNRLRRLHRSSANESPRNTTPSP